MRNSQNFWDKNAGRYDRFMRKDAAAYEQMYELLRPHRGLLGITASGSLVYGLVDTTLGFLATAIGELDDAVDLLTDALHQAEAMEAPFEAVRARRGLAQALAARGDDVADLVGAAREAALARGFAGELAALDAL